MQRLFLTTLLTAGLFGTGSAALAAEKPQAAREEPTRSVSAAKPEIIADDKTGTVRIRVDGKDILVIDANGLQVNGDLAYRGTVTDIGREAKDAP